jgi:small neutral amino acid transporter SnatA (MarC family)
MRNIKRKNIKKVIISATVLLVIGVVIGLLLLPNFKVSTDSVKIEAGKNFKAETYITKVKNIDKN